MYQLISGVTHDDQAANLFLENVYRPEKSRFLIEHGLWWYRGDSHRFVVATDKGQVVGHSAIIPTTCVLDGQQQPSAWYVDLIVDPDFRGRGLQSMLDEAVRLSGDLKFAFPARDLSARIFQKHGWRLREDCDHLTLLFSLLALPRLRQAQSLKGRLARNTARLFTPLLALYRLRLGRYAPKTAREVVDPDAETLAQVFLHWQSGDRRITTWRDAEFIQWRFLDAPYRSQLRFYLAGPTDAPTHVLISRLLDIRGVQTLRILDLFGDLEDVAGLRDILRLAVRDAKQAHAKQVVALSSVPPLTAVLRSIGFRMRRPLQFCWHTPNPALMDQFGSTGCHWTYADSDADY
ncbi:MAG: GNAT family N-acetyltransferase [Chloroflexi bacterium]|nr:GNAT family N-acetyltransferase [Chloroflexota bacterium]